MRHTIYRFFQRDDGAYTLEKTTWVLVGTECINRHDPRAVVIGRSEIVNGKSLDLWIPITVVQPAYDVQLADHEYSIEVGHKIDDYGRLIEGNIKKDVIGFNEMDIYSKPLLPGYTEITMKEYNDGIAASHAI